MAAPKIFFEDFQAGDEMILGPVTLTEKDIVEFARCWDPQPMHLDEEAGRDTFLGGLTASGWHSACILMRLMCDHFLLDAASMGGPGIEEMRWIRPVRPGDTLTVRRVILEARASKSRPDMGIVRYRFEMTNQHGETVMTTTFPGLFGRRVTAEAAK